MAKAQIGDTVKVHYTGKLTDGQIFDDSLNRQPLEFRIGDNFLITGFEKAVIGMQPGEWKTVTIPFSEGYGPHYPEFVTRVPKSNLPEGLVPTIGQQLLVEQEGQNPMVVSVIGIEENYITIDANHPLAGKDLV
ncbi:MAG: peptidylprolyl isomerase, partial [Candidatus Omnitrophica bacterium]|nr:peptidylprolyl isomerase [Candidatus Omnitrophota bacterium]